MGKRGKQTAEVGRVAIEQKKWPNCPKNKTKEYRKRWKEITHSFPADWFSLADLPKLDMYINNEQLIMDYRDKATLAGGTVTNDKGVESVHPLHKEADNLTRINIALSINLKISAGSITRATTRGEIKTGNAPNSSQNKVRPMFQAV